MDKKDDMLKDFYAILQNKMMEYGATNGDLLVCGRFSNPNYGNQLCLERENDGIYLYLVSGLTLDFDSYAFRIKIMTKDHLVSILENVVQK